MVAAWMRAETGAPEQAERDHGERARPGVVDGHGRGLRRHDREIQALELHEHQEEAEDESGVSDAVHDERLLAGVRSALLVEPEADQQIRAEADTFPADE
jgi:hypothetical protein